MGLTAQQWHRKLVKQRHGYQALLAVYRKRIRTAHRALVHRPSSLEAIRLASIAYGASYREMVNIAECETGHTLSPYTKNRSSSASGLFQFLYPSTWNRTPYRSESVWSPYANAMAAAHLWRADGRSWHEWVCRP